MLTEENEAHLFIPLLSASHLLFKNFYEAPPMHLSQDSDGEQEDTVLLECERERKEILFR